MEIKKRIEQHQVTPLVLKSILSNVDWFSHVLGHHHLNGITFERFAGCNPSVAQIYIGWSSSRSCLFDFTLGLCVYENIGGALHAVRLLEWFLSHFYVQHNAFGPFGRFDTRIDIACQTFDLARRLRNWGLHDHSLRHLGWFCTQQHIELVYSGPSIGNISLHRITNELLLQVQQQHHLKLPTLSALPSVPKLERSSSLVSPLPAVEPMIASLPLGKNSAVHWNWISTAFKTSRTLNKMSYWLTCSLLLL